MYSKTFILSFTWLYVTCLMPLVIFHKLNTYESIRYSSIQFCIIYIICLFFDKRDINTEDQFHLFFDTIKNLKKTIFIIDLFFISILILGLKDNQFTLILTIKFLIMILLNFTTEKSLTTKSDYWYYLFLDGMMGISSVIIILASYLK